MFFEQKLLAAACCAVVKYKQCIQCLMSTRTLKPLVRDLGFVCEGLSHVMQIVLHHIPPSSSLKKE